MGAGTGAHHHRIALETSAADVLPTAVTLEAARRAAATYCAERAGGIAWQDAAKAHAWIGAIPLVALAALGELCVDVPMPRLARCLGLDPLDGPDAIGALKDAGTWPAEIVSMVVLAIGGGR